MEIEKIKTIVELMAEHDLTEFKIESDDIHLCIRRGASGVSIVSPSTQPTPVSATALAAAPAASAAVAAEPAEQQNGGAAKPAEAVKHETINAPIVGTFYRASSPDIEPFVKVGSKVNSETVVCIIEAMKVMNEIKAEKSGVVKEILVENARPVEFGQTLFVLE